MKHIKSQNRRAGTMAVLVLGSIVPTDGATIIIAVPTTIVSYIRVTPISITVRAPAAVKAEE